MSLFKIVAQGLTDMEFHSHLVNVGKESAKIVKEASPSESATLAAETLGLIAAPFSVVSGVEGYKTIKKNLKKKKWKPIDYAETAQAGLSMAAGAIVIVKAVDFIRTAHASALGAGTLTVIRNNPATVAIGQTSAIIGIVHLTAEIGYLALKLHEVNKKIVRTKEKITLWHQPIDRDFIATKIAHTSEKNKELAKIKMTAIKALNETKIKIARNEALIEKKTSEVETKTSFGKAHAWVHLQTAETTQKRLLKKQTKKQEELQAINEKYQLREEKIKVWKSFAARLSKGSLDNESTASLEQLQKDKQLKWTAKKKNLKIKKLRLSLDMALKCTLLVVVIASFVLLTTGAGGPPAMISLTSVSLALGLIGLGLYIYNKKQKEKSIPSASLLNLSPT